MDNVLSAAGVSPVPPEGQLRITVERENFFAGSFNVKNFTVKVKGTDPSNSHIEEEKKGGTVSEDSTPYFWLPKGNYSLSIDGYDDNGKVVPFHTTDNFFHPGADLDGKTNSCTWNIKDEDINCEVW